MRQFLEFSQEAAKSAGLQPLQHQALLTIRGAAVGERVTIGMLAQRLCSKPQSTSELVSRMERQGLLARRTGSEDARQVWVEITEPGKEVLQQLAWAHREELRRLRPRLEQLLRNIDPEPIED